MFEESFRIIQKWQICSEAYCKVSIFNLCGGDKMIVKFVWSFSRNTEYFIIFKKLRISGFKATYQCYLKISGNHNFGDNNTATVGQLLFHKKEKV